MSAFREIEAVPGRRHVRLGPLSWTLRPRAALVPLLAIVVLLVVGALNISLGSAQIGPLDVVRTLVGGGDRRETGIVLDLRLPRTLAGALVGASFGLAGALFQTIARNPLASPDILGITWGAGAAAVAVIVTGGSYGQISGPLAQLGVPLAALVGGLFAGLLLYALSWRRGIDGFRMVLIGIGLAAIGYNIVYWLLTVGDVDDAARATVWIVGNLADVGWEAVGPVAVALTVLAACALVYAHTLRGLQFGDDTARGLGIRVDAARGTLLLLAAALAAVATAVAGPITFVALATPQIASRLARTAQPPLAGSMAVGALLTVSADLAVRVVLPGVPVGVLTAILGAPYLLYLLVRGRRA
ncbi:FecCD family ABC transporter permease [Saccharomonospora saliphila]|uniref:FecCD family ABC transporter permease n=1 Tax=Saccharomonospora saliphila TaxID=369829 RepID=UPI00037AF771|nr:iron chelate uptake ABC transporter family permease subunit [Saccharomonospora saliphila]